MSYKIFLLAVACLAATFGMLNKRWAVACSICVMLCAIGSFTADGVSRWVAEHRQDVCPSESYASGRVVGLHDSGARI
ncbi:hypothetical protein FO488_10510 [Geobacter sp. FeAm09]|uniref:hypothetical protein n=1 Tax=Geobacter sp. FeAm09 TaxID=2597769 RepID=UPI0011EDD350|nr:hypothetical protein [Geobacter sp. FeAm09]QEM68559.1 hypothetical protein FO488_10510 [Geobacter sp. FeAm09]